MSNDESTLREKCKEAILKLKQLQINFVAIDFDKTLVDVHTCGRWTDNSTVLATKLRPLFKCFVPMALDNKLCVAIVTFSGQTTLIQEVLRTTFPNHHEQIVLRARDNSWGNMGGSRDGKQNYMASAAIELEKNYSADNLDITRNSSKLY